MKFQWFGVQNNFNLQKSTSNVLTFYDKKICFIYFNLNIQFLGLISNFGIRFLLYNKYTFWSIWGMNK